MSTTEKRPDGTCHLERSTFRMEYSVSICIAAPPGRIWSLLTDAAELPRWNSTVDSVEGTIARGEKITVRVPLAPDRAFKLTVAELIPEQKMVWMDGLAPVFRGRRTFTLSPEDDGTTRFHMSEVFSGLMLPLIARSLPDFGPSFETYAADLERAATSAGATESA